MSRLADVKQRLSELLPRGVARASSWAGVGQATMMVASLARFLLLARLVGPADYGAVAGALGLVLTVGPFAALGADKLVTRDITGSPATPAAALTSAVTTVATGATVATVALALLHPVILPQVPLALLLFLAVAELAANGVVACCAGSRFAVGEPRAGGITMMMKGLANILSVVVFALTDTRNVVWWATLYAIFTATAAIVGAAWAFVRFGRPVLVGYRPLARIREGLPYSANVSATIAQNDVDKTLLVRAGYSEEAGLYSVAYRLATMAWLPVFAVLQASYPRFFELGKEGGLSATAAFARRLMRPLAAYAVLAAVVLVVGAPVIPLLVGEEYRGSVPLLMLLSPLALLKVTQYFPSDALTGAGHQPIRTACIIVSTLLNVVLNILFIPRYGLAAALAATFVAEVAYASLVHLAVRIGMRRESNSRTMDRGSI